MSNRRLLSLCFGAFFTLSFASHSAPAQDTKQQGAPTDVIKNPVTEEKPDPLKRRISDRQRLQQQTDMKKELKGEYQKWLNEDVRWIITDQELAAFKQLSNDEERDAFREAFWQRRNPDPDAPGNEALDEHYRRIAWAN